MSTFARFAGVAVGSTLLTALPCRAEVRDVDLKAAYIYNFAQFTVWPGERAGAPLAVCAQHAGALWEALRAYNGRLVDGRAWQVVDAAARPHGLGCAILVIGRTAGMQAAARADAAAPAQAAAQADTQPDPQGAAQVGTPAGSGILVVRDGIGPGAEPAAVTLVDDDEQLRFDIDTRQVTRAGLRMSSKLLRLARNVR